MARLASVLTQLARNRQLPAATIPRSHIRLTDIPIAANPGALRMLLYTPPSLRRKAPLVVVLHGCAQDGASYAEGAGWLTLADRYGFAVLCPEQTRANNPNLCFNWFQPADIVRDGGEASSIRAMIARASSDHSLDPARVFITGLSAGGAMTAVMLATYPEVFAAGAIVAGLPYGAASSVREALTAMLRGADGAAAIWGDKVRGASTHEGPWPRLSIWHGGADATVRAGADDNLVAQWTDLHAVSEPTFESVDSNGRHTRIWRSATGAALVEHHRISRMGHGTPLCTSGPQGCGTAGPFLLEVGISSSLEIARFWGLAEAIETSNPDKSLPVQQVRRTQHALPHFAGPQRTSTRPAADIGGTIANALRAAGLMK